MIKKVWNGLLKPALRRRLYAAKHFTASFLRQSIPFLDKRIPFLGRRLRRWEWVWQPVFSHRYFDRFYKRQDPFRFDTLPYEVQKYADTLRLLNNRRYERALELGASEGAFTEQLAPLCSSLLTVEVAASAVERAKRRLSRFSHVTCIQAALPHEMPSGPFDLIVASDVLYYLPRDVLTGCLDRIRAELRPGGILFVLDYLGDFGQPVSGREVHDILKQRPDLEVIHDQTIIGEGPKASKGYAVTLFRKQPEPMPVVSVRNDPVPKQEAVFA